MSLRFKSAAALMAVAGLATAAAAPADTVKSRSIGASTAAAGAAAGKRVCGRYSSFLLAPGETAEIEGAGATSVSMRITGPQGVWIFYDGLTSPVPASDLGTQVHEGGKARAYRRSYDARVYVVVPTFDYAVDGKQVQASVSGLDFMRQPLVNPAIVGTDADLAVVKRIFPAQQDVCDLRWMPGVGLMESR